MRRAIPLLVLLAVAAASAPAGASTLTHVVRPGETVDDIARRYGVTVAELLRENGLADGAPIHPGQVLRIPAAPPPQPPVMVRSGPGPLHRPVAVVSRGTGYRVLARAGDWVQVRLPDGQVGWVRASDLERPAPAAAPPSPSAPPRPAVDLRARLIADAFRYLGVPYRWGGASPAALDCSGLIVVVYGPHVPALPRTSYDQFRFGRPLRPEQVMPGDLVFFSTEGAGPSHVGIYLGGWQFLHASSAAGRVQVSTLASPFYARTYLGARRILP